MDKKPDAYKMVTERIVAAVEAGPAAWAKAWKSFSEAGPSKNGLSGKEYHGINTLILAFSGFSDCRWYTFDQAKEAVGYKKNPLWKGKADTFKGIPKWVWDPKKGEDPKYGVKAGEKGTHVVFWSTYDATEKEVDPVTGEEKRVSRKVPMARLYVVFNANQINGLKGAPAQIDPAIGHAEVAKALEALSATVLHGGDKAFYSPSEDIIRMPEVSQFDSTGDYWATRAHELVHWTGHKSRCDRTFGGRFGDETYAMEELVAEIGAAFVCARLGVSGEFRHPEYVAFWLKVLGKDKYAIFSASREAAKAVDFLLGVEPKEEVAEEEEAAA